jgi:RND family efflux transporter MFP subunit
MKRSALSRRHPKLTPTLRVRLLSGVLLCALLFAAGCAAEPGDAGAATGTKLTPVSVTTAAVTAERASPPVNLTGVTEPVRRATPAARVMARVLAAGFREGERVRGGQALIRLDTKDLQARRRQAQAALATAATSLEVATLNLSRMSRLHESGTVSKPQMEGAQVAQSQASAAREAARSAIDEIDVNLSYSVSVAPFPGVIVRKLVEVGNMVAPGQPLYVIEDDSRLRVVAPVGTDLAAGLEPGGVLTVRIQGECVQGTIEGIVSSGDAQAPGQRVQLLVDNRGARYRAGTLAAVEVPQGKAVAMGVVVPRAALIERGALTGVYVVARDRTAALRWLVVGEDRGDAVRVISGLHEGDRVILRPGGTGVADGKPVTEAAR